MTNKPDISVVIPVYNSHDAIEELYARINKELKHINKSFEIIFVDDFSKDNSWAKLNEVKQNNPHSNITIIKLARNFGQHKATLCGIEHSCGDFIITMDDDLQHPPEEIHKLIEKQIETGADIVYGTYTEKKHSRIRNIASKTIKKASKIMEEAPGEGSSFRLISNEVAQKILEQHRIFVFIDELLLWYTGNLAFVPVKHDVRKYNKSNYTPSKLVGMSTRIFAYSTTAPLKFMVIGGLVVSFISFMFGLYFIYRKIFFNVPLGYTSIIVAVLFSTSLLMLSLGMVGEYLSRVFTAINKKPPYLINKIMK